MRFHCRKLIFPLQVDVSWLGVWAQAYFPILVLRLGPVWALCLLSQPLWVCICASVLLSLETVLFHWSCSTCFIIVCFTILTCHILYFSYGLIFDCWYLFECSCFLLLLLLLFRPPYVPTSISNSIISISFSHSP